MNGRIEQVESVPDAFAQLVVDRLAAAGDGAGFSLFLSGGSTAEECYRSLAERGRPGVVDWSSVDVYLGDERCVPLDDPDSNHRMIAETLLDAVAPVRSDHPMYEAGSPEAAAAAYQQAGRAAARLRPRPPGARSRRAHRLAVPRVGRPRRRRSRAAGGGQPRSQGQQSPRPDHPHPGRHRPGPPGRLHRHRGVEAGPLPTHRRRRGSARRHGSPPTRSCGWSMPASPAPTSPPRRPDRSRRDRSSSQPAPVRWRRCPPTPAPPV